HRLQHLAGALDARVAALVAPDVMAVPHRARDHVHAVRALLKRLQDVADVRLTGAGQPDKRHIRRVLEAEHPGSVSCHVASIDTVEGRNLRLEGVVIVAVWLRRHAHGLAPGSTAAALNGCHAPNPPCTGWTICTSR